MDTFNFNAAAVGLKGYIVRPFDIEFPTIASVALEPKGGFVPSREQDIQLENIVFAKSVTSVVAGSFGKDGTVDELASVVVENLNILGIVTADRVVGRLAAVHPGDRTSPSITPLGSHFDNLRIAGHKIELDLAIDTFTRLDTNEKVRSAYQNNERGFRDEFSRLSLLGKIKEIPELLHSHFPFSSREHRDSIPERDGAIHSGLVREIAGLGSGITSFGHVVHVPGFGVIRIAEFSIIGPLRILTMLQVDLGSTPSGGVTTANVRANGSSSK